MTTNRADRLAQSDAQEKDARPDDRTPLGDTAKRAAVATLVVIAIVAAALALWKLKVILAVVFLGITIAAAMRSGVDQLAARHVPRSIGTLLHFVAVFGLVALLLWLAVRVR
jgi:predicted PurR-regulated permease PerM